MMRQNSSKKKKTQQPMSQCEKKVDLSAMFHQQQKIKKKFRRVKNNIFPFTIHCRLLLTLHFFLFFHFFSYLIVDRLMMMMMMIDTNETHSSSHWRLVFF